MTEPVEREVRHVARGRAWYTPFEALGGVTLIVAAAVAIVLAITFTIWLLA
jgi:hypothetical protein